MNRSTTRALWIEAGCALGLGFIIALMPSCSDSEEERAPSEAPKACTEDFEVPHVGSCYGCFPLSDLPGGSTLGSPGEDEGVIDVDLEGAALEVFHTGEEDEPVALIEYTGADGQTVRVTFAVPRPGEPFGGGGQGGHSGR